MDTVDWYNHTNSNEFNLFCCYLVKVENIRYLFSSKIPALVNVFFPLKCIRNTLSILWAHKSIWLYSNNPSKKPFNMLTITNQAEIYSDKQSTARQEVCSKNRQIVNSKLDN